MQERIGLATSPPWVLPFSEIDRTSLPLVGGKGASLGELTRAGFPVPPGFCVTTTPYRQFLASHPNPDGLFAPLDALDSGDVEGVRQVAAEIRRQLLRVPIPAPV